MFIIKKHYVATEANHNFKGEERTYYEGKAGQHIGDLNGTYPRNWEIKEYGYKTYAAAMRGLKAVLNLANWEMGYGKWTITAEVIKA